MTLQQEKAWGSSVVKQLSQDLMNAYPGVSGFSRTNLFAMRQMVMFFDPDSEIVPQAVGQLPWGHIRVLMAKTKELSTAEYYAKATLEYGWTRDVLASFFVRIEIDSMSNMPCETSISQSGSVHSNSMKFRAIYKLSCQL
jgi:predicted nuclease of restriction endonuclease-like (RecB) superfamily